MSVDMRKVTEAFNAITGHNISEDDGVLFGQILKIAETHANAGKAEEIWIPHDGGRCPPIGPTLVNVKFRNSNIKMAVEASDVLWIHSGWSDHDIVGYQIHKPA